MTRRTWHLVALWAATLPALYASAWASTATGAWWTTPAVMAAVTAGTLVLMVRDLPARDTPDVQASVAANYQVSRDVWFGRQAVFVEQASDGSWHPVQPAPVPVPVPAVPEPGPVGEVA